MDTEQATCTKCGSAKDSDAFYYSKGKRNPWCKACYREWHRGRYAPQDEATDDPRPCAVCGKVFVPRKRAAAVYCSRACKERDRRESGLDRQQHLLRKYGLTQAAYQQMLSEQDDGCALCGVKPEDLTVGRFRTFLHVDHCHDTGKVRGLLCPDHNLLLGRWGHDPVLLRRAADYLEA